METCEGSEYDVMPSVLNASHPHLIESDRVMLREDQHFCGLRLKLLGTLYLIQNTTYEIGGSTSGFLFKYARDILTHILV